MKAVALTVTGRLSPGFVPWICHRAALLDLAGWVSQDGSGLTIVVTGPAPLIAAMETACSLGPADGVVDRIDATEIEVAAPPNGFAVR